ncbi:uncharacterized protein EDB91DRAFT_1248982 [Suillus paluster]|uniref:uncharacterized protein n=1 Tax=Suillus paluster TaxID=48578 RepID=UPI001B87C423|nr:uncharacterized protein EDB91DRAFT_1248982 [Suillus paluster]KAG1738821.1 hypothetical protein EDB91DRAFT_1248982 [Suillus paluster]
MMLQLMFFKDCTTEQPSSSSATTSGTSATYTDIHEGDIAHFAQVGFEALIQSLANQQGFQADVIRTVYKYLTSYEETVEVIEEMREVAEECAVAEILSRTEEDEEDDHKEDSNDIKSEDE